MGRGEKEMMARIGGMEYALRTIKEKGIEEFEKELRWRNRYGVSVPISREEIGLASSAIKWMATDTFRVLSIATLRDEFDFGQKRIQRFVTRFDSKAKDLQDDLVTWDEYVEQLKKELGGLELEIRFND